MQNTTREKILFKAQVLFNEEGYQHITMRRIADELGMSVGNLTYHFKHKQDIVEALIHDIQLLTKERSAQDLLDLNAQLEKMLKSLINGRFFFVSDDLANLNPEFAEKNRLNVSRLRTNLFDILQELSDLGFFNQQFDKKAQDAWVEMIMLAHLAWARSLDLNQDPQSQLHDFLNLHWTTLLPYLSKKGLIQKENMFNQK